MVMVVMQSGSEAFHVLWLIVTDRDTYKVSVDVRPDGVALKRNEGAWTNTLRVSR